MKKLIVNADDFGYSRVFNESILDLAEKGFITSTSVMVEWIDESQSEQIQQLIDLSDKVSVGLHMDFKSTDFDSEIERQAEKFKQVFGFDPAHIDIHKSTYKFDGYPHIIKYSQDHQIPCKNINVEPFTKWMMKDEIFDGTKKSFEEIEQWMSGLKDGGYYAAIFHPGKYDPESKSSFNEIRERDTENIIQMNSKLSEYEIELVNYSDFLNNL